MFPITSVVAFDVSSDQLDDFERDVDEWLGIETTRASSVEAAVGDADIVCVVTTAPKPVLMEEWLNTGVHVCAATGFRDVDKACAKAFDKWVVGWYGRDLEWIEGAEVGKLGGLQPGDLTKADIHADIASELISGARPGRETPTERTIMTHMGMPALDAAVASLVYDLALVAGVGTWITIF